MSEIQTDNPLNHHFWVVPTLIGYVSLPVMYELLAKESDKIECWVKKIPSNPLDKCQVLSLSNMNSKYMEKVMANKWAPDLRVLAMKKNRGNR